MMNPCRLTAAIPLLITLTLVAQTNAPPAVSLHMAAMTGDTASVHQHIKAGSDLNQLDAYGSSPLTIATVFGNTEAAIALIQAGADLDTRNSQGATPLHTAALLCRADIAQSLLDHGADRHTRDSFGNTPSDSIASPFEDVKHVYDAIATALGPLGLKLDYDRIRSLRPQVFQMLRPDPEEIQDIDYAPQAIGGWPVSTPTEQGLDPNLVAELYLDAEHMPRLYSLIIIKNGKIVAERYYNGSSVDNKTRLASVTKSFTSAVTGIALDKGVLDSIDQKMIASFPEVADAITDPRKNHITVRHLLQMRAGYPWEEMKPEYWDGILSGDYVPLIEKTPLLGDPGSQFNYSNFSSNWLGIILTRASGSSLKNFTQTQLLDAIDAQAGEWGTDAHGHNNGCGNLHLTARDAAKLGLVYLNRGRYRGQQVVPAEWVEDSLKNYSPDAWITKDKINHIGPYFRELGYGYQWWSATVGEHDIDFAWGHGGQLVILLHDLDMVLATTTDAFFLQHDDEAWRHEKSTINLVGKFIRSLPKP